MSPDTVPSLSAEELAKAEVQSRLSKAEEEIRSILEKHQVRLVGSLKAGRYGILPEVDIIDAKAKEEPKA